MTKKEYKVESSSDPEHEAYSIVCVTDYDYSFGKDTEYVRVPGLYGGFKSYEVAEAFAELMNQIEKLRQRIDEQK